MDDADRLRLEGQSTQASAAYAAAYRALPLPDKTSVIGIRVLQLALQQAQETAELDVLERATALAEEAQETFASTGTPWPEAVARAQEAAYARAHELRAAQGRASPPPSARAEPHAVDPAGGSSQGSSSPPPSARAEPHAVDPAGGSAQGRSSPPPSARAEPHAVDPAGGSSPAKVPEGMDHADIAAREEGHGPSVSAMSPRGSALSRWSSPSHRPTHVGLLTGGAVLMSAGVGLILGGVFVSDGTQEYAVAMMSPAYEALQADPQRFATYEAAVARWQTQRRTARVALWSSGAVALAAGVALVLIDVLPHARRRFGRVSLGRGLDVRF